MTDRAEDLLRLLGQHIPQTRQVLRKLIPDQLVQGKLVPGRIVCTPFDDARGQGYTFLARGSYSRLLGTGIAINNGGGGHPMLDLFQADNPRPAAGYARWVAGAELRHII